MTEYIRCTADEVRHDVRWDVPERNQGQTIEVAYARATPVAHAACEGDEYKRVTDRSLDPRLVTYFRRADVPALRLVVLDIRGETNYGVIRSVHATADEAYKARQRLARGLQREALIHLMWTYRQMTVDEIQMSARVRLGRESHE